MHLPTTKCFGALFALLALSVGFFVAAPQSASAQQNVILVLDSSGSMAGRIGGVRKIDIARKAVGNILGAMDPKTKLGLFAYGHRRKGDCSDIQMIHGIGTPNRSSMMQAVNALKPVGKTPLSDAVRMAAEKMKYTEEKATVILVSDGIETCNADPCALGSQLKKQGVDFKVHVVGFNIRRGEESGLQCLAKNTGGIYVAANNANSLNRALTEAVKKVEAEPQPVRKVEAPPPAPKVAIDAGIKVRALVTAGGPVWDENITITLFGQPEGLDGNRKRLALARNKASGFILKDIKPGTYRLQIEGWNNQHVVRQVDVRYDGGAQAVDVVMNIGQIRMDALYKEGGRPVPGNMTWIVSEKAADFQGRRKNLATLRNKRNKSVYWFPAGSWRVDGEVWDHSHIHVTTQIDVKAGGAEVKPVPLNVALVRFDTRLAKGGPLYDRNLTWDFFSGQPDISGKRKRLTTLRNVKVNRVVMLPAGEWQVKGALWDASNVDFGTTIKVEADTETPHEVIIGAARVRFNASVDGKPPGENFSIKLLDPSKDLAGKQRSLGTFLNKPNGFVAVLKAGKYQVATQLWNRGKVRGETMIDIKPGVDQSVMLNLALN